MPSTSSTGTGGLVSTVAVPGGHLAYKILADRHPDRVASLVLVDGVFPVAVAPELTRDTVALPLADRVGRLERTWDSVNHLLAYFCATTAPLLDPTDPLLRHHLEHDLRDGRVRLSSDAVATTVVGVDGVDHAGSIMSHRGALATADLVREALA